MKFFKGLVKGLKNNWIRATELSEAARDTGKRGVTPELGVGEFLRGFVNAKIDKADAEDPKFTENLRSCTLALTLLSSDVILHLNLKNLPFMVLC